MTDINEKETIQYFINGIRKARSAAKELALLNHKSAWSQVAATLDVLLVNAQKLYTGKPQTRMESLILATKIQDANETVH